MSSKISHSTNRAVSNFAQAYHSIVASDRERLIEAHLPQVKYIAERLAAKLPPSVDRDDLIGAGLIGLLSAVDKFDPSRGVLFKTYAEMRVRGAMLDSLRDLDWAPRSMRRRAREVEAAYLQIERERGRTAQEEEVALALGLSMQEFQMLLGELRGLTVTGFDGSDDDDEIGALSRTKVPVDSSHTPLARYEQAEMRDHLTAAVEALPERERQVIALYYVEELTMKEIGAVLSVTESRVSQIHTQSVIRLRAALAMKRINEVLAF